MPISPSTPVSTFVARRKALLERLDGPALISAGLPQPRNFRANEYPYRSTSHFLYFVGRHIPGAALLFADGETILFTESPDPEDALWHGPRPALEELKRELSFDDVRDLATHDRAAESLAQPSRCLLYTSPSPRDS